jgi:hypothetical protein
MSAICCLDACCLLPAACCLLPAACCLLSPAWYCIPQHSLFSLFLSSNLPQTCVAVHKVLKIIIHVVYKIDRSTAQIPLTSECRSAYRTWVLVWALLAFGLSSLDLSQQKGLQVGTS